MQNAEADFWSVFLLTHSYFSSSVELFTHIRTAYERLVAAPLNTWAPLWRKQCGHADAIVVVIVADVVSFSLLQLLRNWLEQRREDLRSDSVVFRLIEEFVTKTLPAHKEEKSTLDALTLALDLLRPHTSSVQQSNSRIVLFSSRKIHTDVMIVRQLIFCHSFIAFDVYYHSRLTYWACRRRSSRRR